MGEHRSDTPFDDALQRLPLRGVMPALPTFVICVDRQRRLQYFSFERRVVPELIGKSLDGFIAPAHRDAVAAAIDLAFSSGERQVIAYDGIQSDGSTRHLKGCVVPLQGQGGELAVLIISDETDWLARHSELQRDEDFRGRVLDSVPDFVTLLDREHRFIWVNRTAPGFDVRHVIGSKIESFLTPESITSTCGAIDATFETGEPQQCQTEGYGDPVSTRWWLNRTVPMLVDGKTEAVLLVTSDMSELKRSEQALRDKDRQLQHAQHLESIGQLAGGIAHDFNNLLQVIDGNLHFIREGLELGEDVSEDLEQAVQATRSAAELTSRLLAVGRRKRVATTRVDLVAFVSTNLRALRAALTDGIELVFEAARSPCFVQVDNQEFEQVLMNLCLNARDAMPNGGTLRVSVDCNEEQAILNVSDTGIGIPKENLARVFEPFFTTKASRSGLGLAVVAGIVAAHGGSIVAESDGVHGTKICVRLPCAEADRAPPRVSREPRARTSACILVAEDEPRVRAQVVRILEAGGYSVLEAEDGQRAIELFKESADKIDLVLLDAIMPRCDGWQAYAEIARMKPGIKALFTTGYAANVLPSDFSARGARLLSKPFKPAELLAKVSDLLAPTARQR